MYVAAGRLVYTCECIYPSTNLAVFILRQRQEQNTVLYKMEGKQLSEHHCRKEETW